MSNAVNLNDVAQFVRVAELGSFTAAAQSLGLPKTSVSRRIARLEDVLGTRLFHRTTRRLNLTSAGELYLAAVGPSLANVADAGNAVQPGNGEPRGVLRISAPVSFGDHFLAAQVNGFLLRFPNLQIELVLTDTDLDMTAHRIDLAFKIETALPDTSLIARKLANTHKILVASPAFIEDNGRPDEPSDLTEADCIVLGDRLDQKTWRMVGPAGTCAVAMRPRLAATTIQSVLSAAEAGLGFALVPKALVFDRIAHGSLVHCLPGYRTEETALYAVYPSKRQVPVSVSAVLDVLSVALHDMRTFG